MSKMRVYEVARDLGLENKAVVALFQAIGVTDVRNHMSAVLPEQVERAKRHLEKQGAEAVVEERLRHGVVKRRVKRAGAGTETSSPAASPAPVEARSPSPAPLPKSPPAPPRVAAAPEEIRVRAPLAAPKTGVEVWQGRPGVPMPQAPRGAPPPRRVQYDAKAGSSSGPQRRGGPMMSGRPQHRGRAGGGP